MGCVQEAEILVWLDCIKGAREMGKIVKGLPRRIYDFRLNPEISGKSLKGLSMGKKQSLVFILFRLLPDSLKGKHTGLYRLKFPLSTCH